ncbi:sugar isomerase [Microbacterium sp. Root61]|uniref:SIS domain-containing protein n=1 Tax=Microbacterium sp. Root61 TaxID=1736570 RepID=UPI000700CFB2|nr:SIS domain-containing protein [Microbacterium sp. Root61]KRA24939.1 sugar isomerase [Microbacterium sp. Root61]
MTVHRFVQAEIDSQPETWTRVSESAPSFNPLLPSRGQKVAVVGCGTSWFIGQSYAVLREGVGHGVTDAFAASEFPAGRDYDVIVAITRSGTTSEVIELLSAAGDVPTVVITGDAASPAARIATSVIELDFADEKSVVQTRFATSALIALRCSLGEEVDLVIEDAARALQIPIDDLLGAEQVTFLGTGWSVGIASEAALKAREAAQLWTEAYPAMDYRHGPISIAQSGRLVWAFGALPVGLEADVSTTGARLVRHDLDPLAGLIVAQRFAVAEAEARGLNPDEPRSLTRSVILA